MNITGSLSNDRNCRFLAIIFRVSNLVRPDLDELSDIRPVQLVNTNVKRGTLESCYAFFLSPRNPAHFPLHFGFHHLVPVTAFPALIVIRLAKIASLLPNSTESSLSLPFPSSNRHRFYPRLLSFIFEICSIVWYLYGKVVGLKKYNVTFTIHQSNYS